MFYIQICYACKNVESWHSFILGAFQSPITRFSWSYARLYLSRILNDGTFLRNSSSIHPSMLHCVQGVFVCLCVGLVTRKFMDQGNAKTNKFSALPKDFGNMHCQFIKICRDLELVGVSMCWGCANLRPWSKRYLWSTLGEVHQRGSLWKLCWICSYFYTFQGSHQTLCWSKAGHTRKRWFSSISWGFSIPWGLCHAIAVVDDE